MSGCVTICNEQPILDYTTVLPQAMLKEPALYHKVAKPPLLKHRVWCCSTDREPNPKLLERQTAFTTSMATQTSYIASDAWRE